MSGSSIGTIAGGVVGGIIGFFAGGNVALGATLGMAIGGAIGGALDPPKTPELKGPRLGDLSVQTSTYGAIIPRNYGVIAQYGNIFWLQNDKITEVETDASAGGKGGFGKPKQKNTTFSYFATFAVGLCEGPIDGIKKMWMGSDLVYDAGSTVVSDVIASMAASQYFTLYLGNDTQLPDPSIQADKGVANTPAYRGLAYIVFNDVPLESYNNSLLGAQVKVEIVKAGVSSYVYSNTSDNLPAGSQYYVSAPYIADGLLRMWQISGAWDSVLTPTIYQYLLPYQGAPILMRAGGVTLPSLRPFYSPGLCHGKADVDILALPHNYVNGGVCLVDKDFGATTIQSVVPGMGGADRCHINSGYVYFCCSVTPSGASFTRAKTDGTDATDIPIPFSVTLGNGAQALGTVGNSLIASFLNAGDSNKDYVIVWDKNTLAFISSNPVTTVFPGITSSRLLSFTDNKIYYDKSGDIYHRDDIGSPEILDIVGYNHASGSYIYPWEIHADTGTLIASFLSDPSVKNVKTWVNQIIADQIPLSEIVQAEALNSQLLIGADLDVTELTDIVRGYRVSAMGAIRGGIEPLRSSWPFDVMQHGYQIKFKKRGSASIATIPSTALDARSAGAKPGIQITNAREMDSILAKKVTIKYLDNTREYDTNEQYAARINTDAVNEISIEIPVVFNAQEAAQKAEVLLYLYWMERYDISFVLPYTYANLEPGDVITLNGENATYELRLTTLNTLPDGRIECRAKHSKAALYSPVALGEEGQSVGAGMILPGPTTYELLDIPMLRDADNTPGFPAAMTGYLAGWPGGALFRSEDGGQTFTSIEDFASPGSTIGYATTSLTAHGGTVLDKSSTLTVILYQGTLSSITETQLFAGSNWFAYGLDTRWEIMAAQKCVLQGDGSYILTDFLRGQNGTEWATGLHLAADKIILLDTARLAFIASQSAAIGVAKLYRGITAGKALASESNRSFTYNAVNLECLSPCALTGNRHPTTNDWTLIWTRRSRFAGWRDLIDAALGETTESYEVDIFSSGTYTTLKRTLTASTQTVAYTSANQVTDFGSNQATLYVKIYQLSATVSRGYPLIATITR